MNEIAPKPDAQAETPQTATFTIANWAEIVKHGGPHAEVIIKHYSDGVVSAARINAAMLGIVTLAICGLAYFALVNGEAGIAEKIVIALLAFVGGYGAGRNK